MSSEMRQELQQQLRDMKKDKDELQTKHAQLRKTSCVSEEGLECRLCFESPYHRFDTCSHHSICIRCAIETPKLPCMVCHPERK
jgi:hypothetical protein